MCKSKLIVTLVQKKTAKEPAKGPVTELAKGPAKPDIKDETQDVEMTEEVHEEKADAEEEGKYLGKSISCCVCLKESCKRIDVLNWNCFFPLSSGMKCIPGKANL